MTNVKELSDTDLLKRITGYGRYDREDLLGSELEREAETRGFARCDNHPDLYAESNQIMDSRFGRVAYCKTCMRTEAAHINV